MTQIKIDSISQDQTKVGDKITLLSGKLKYSFFKKKKDGEETKAHQQFKKYAFSIGDVVSAEVVEEDREFVGREGNTIKFTQRTILYFQEVENTPVVNTPKNNESRLAALEERVNLLEVKDPIKE